MSLPPERTVWAARATARSLSSAKDAGRFWPRPNDNHKSDRFSYYRESHRVSSHADGRRRHVQRTKQRHWIWTIDPFPISRYPNNLYRDRSELPHIARFGLFGGYQFSSRRIRSIEQLNFGDPIPDRKKVSRTVACMRADSVQGCVPSKALTFIADGEIGRADRPVYPTSEKNYHLLGGRVRYKSRSLAISGLARTNYNFNSTSLFAHRRRHAHTRATYRGRRGNGLASMRATADYIWIR